MTDKPEETRFVALHPRLLEMTGCDGRPMVQFLEPPPHVFPEGRTRILREDKAVRVRYHGAARNTIDRLIRRQELRLVPAPKE